MRLRIKVGLNQSRTWSKTTVSVHNQYIKRKKWPTWRQNWGSQPYTWPPLRKVGGPLTPGPPRIAATDDISIWKWVKVTFHDKPKSRTNTWTLDNARDNGLWVGKSAIRSFADLTAACEKSDDPVSGHRRNIKATDFWQQNGVADYIKCFWEVNK